MSEETYVYGEAQSDAELLENAKSKLESNAIGFEDASKLPAEERAALIARGLVKPGLTATEADTKFRKGEWSLQQYESWLAFTYKASRG